MHTWLGMICMHGSELHQELIGHAQPRLRHWLRLMHAHACCSKGMHACLARCVLLAAELHSATTAAAL